MTVRDNGSALQMRQAIGTTGQAPDAGLARDLSELARNLQADPSLEVLLQHIAEAAVDEVEPASYAGISEITGKQVQTRAATGPVAREIDELQYRHGQGPCLTSLRDQVTVRIDDLRVETRWPHFATAAADTGVYSMLSVQLFVDDDNFGALNLYADPPHAFEVSHESTAMLIAAHSAIAMKGKHVETGLRTALSTRDLIGQAKGILMERYRINQAMAFDLLVMASQNNHRKLHDIAEELTATGELPTPEPRRPKTPPRPYRSTW